MLQKMNLKEIERRAFRSTFQDGLWDIYLGLLLLNWVIAMMLTGTGLPLPWVMVIMLASALLQMLAFWAGKRFVTTPRIGLVKFGPQRQAKMKNLRAVLFLSVLLGVIMSIVGLGARGNGLPGWLAGIPIPAYVWAAQAIVVFGLGAYFLDVTRFYVYGVLYGLPFPVGVLLSENTTLTGLSSLAITFGVAAGVMILIGVVLFVRFLRDYPVPAEGPRLEGAFDDQ